MGRAFSIQYWTSTVSASKNSFPVELRSSFLSTDRDICKDSISSATSASEDSVSRPYINVPINSFCPGRVAYAPPSQTHISLTDCVVYKVGQKSKPDKI